MLILLIGLASASDSLDFESERKQPDLNFYDTLEISRTITEHEFRGYVTCDSISSKLILLVSVLSSNQKINGIGFVRYYKVGKQISRDTSFSYILVPDSLTVLYNALSGRGWRGSMKSQMRDAIIIGKNGLNTGFGFDIHDSIIPTAEGAIWAKISGEFRPWGTGMTINYGKNILMNKDTVIIDTDEKEFQIRYELKRNFQKSKQ